MAFIVLVYVAMGVFVAQAALTCAEAPPDVRELWPWSLVWAFVVGVVALVMPYAKPSNPGRDHFLTRSKYTGVLHARNVMLLFAVAPLAILLTFGVAKILDQHPIVGPEPDSWFRQIGWDVSYGVPLVAIALVFVGHAIRDRSSPFAFSAGLLFNIVATIVIILRLAQSSLPTPGTSVDHRCASQRNCGRYRRARLDGHHQLAQEQGKCCETASGQRTGDLLVAPYPRLLVFSLAPAACNSSRVVRGFVRRVPYPGRGGNCAHYTAVDLGRYGRWADRVDRRRAGRGSGSLPQLAPRSESERRRGCLPPPSSPSQR